MENKVYGSITKRVAFTTELHMTTPDLVQLDFTTEEIIRIQRYILLAQEENISIKMEYNATEFFEELEGEVSAFMDYDEGPSYILITDQGKLFYTSQDDNDATTLIESEEFTLNEIKWEPYVPNLQQAAPDLQ